MNDLNFAYLTVTTAGTAVVNPDTDTMITTGNINSGGNSGNQIAVQGGQGNVAVDGGTVTNQTSVDLSADGGTATATANGGNDNTATGGAGGANGTGGNAAAGNGGEASAQANGGTITTGNINSGGNEGNVITVG